MKPRDKMVETSEALEFTWLRRTNFSRSVCYGLGSHGHSLTELPFSKTEEEKSVAFFKNTTMPTFSRHRANESLDCSSSGTSPDVRGGSPFSNISRYDSESTSNQEHDGEEEDQEGGIERKKGQVRRLISWSEQFSRGMGECNAVENAEEWMPDLSQLLIGPRLACGMYSRLYHGLYKGKAVALKMIRLPDDGDNAIRVESQFRCEVQWLSQLHHPNIVELMGACKKPPVFCIVVEYLPGGSLRSFLHSQELDPLPFNLMIDMALDIARGMEYLHAQGIIHRDLKSANLLLTKDLRVKIIDFGSACQEMDSQKPMKDVGTYRWMAPELIAHKSHSRKVDVYSFAIVLWELLTLRIPFEEMTPVQAAFAVTHKNARPKVPNNCQESYRDLMEKCWSVDPYKRPKFSHVVKTLEQMKISTEFELSFTIWQNPQKHANLLHRFFASCMPKALKPS